jgi:hypothetical protein
LSRVRAPWRERRPIPFDDQNSQSAVPPLSSGRLPDESYEGRIEFVVWSIPALTVILLGGVIWIGSHQLDPRAPIPAQSDPLRVDVVALDWKWLFIYPDKGAAIVNQLVGKIVLKGRAGECPPTSLAGRHTTVISSANTPGNPRGANAVPSRV